MRHGNGEEPEQAAVQQHDGQRLHADPRLVARVQRFEQRRRRAVEAHVGRSQERGPHQRHQAAERDHGPVQPGENAVELHALPERAVLGKVEVERLVVRPVAHVVTEMPLAQEMERRREQQREDDPGRVVHAAVRMEQVVLGLVDERVDGVHHDAPQRRQHERTPPDAHAPGRPQDGAERRDLDDGDDEVEPVRDADLASGHRVPATGP